MKVWSTNPLAWLVFVFAEYCTIASAILPPVAEWSYHNIHAHLLLLLPGAVVAYWVFEPRFKGKEHANIDLRLVIGAVVLLAVGFLTLAVGEYADRHHFPHP